VSFRQAYVTPSSLPEVTPKNRPKWNTILDERKGKRMSKNKHSAQFCHNRVREPNEPQPRFSALVRRNTKSTRSESTGVTGFPMVIEEKR
jgi:hypothetical protein